MLITFTLPGVTLSQNKLVGKHWTIKHEQKTFWHQLVMATCGRPEEDVVPTIQGGKARVHVVRVSKRFIDPLNVPAGCQIAVQKIGQVFQHAHPQ
ncbi:hypothetical protein [Anatilimnocola floriformis]|uniref:hypothetical protein n=1 Tax=Anatilimnocola floriformis TaxID=2948575 RepID=UPI0020C4EC1E|nr:hypothetical protein [Anatilimnocola floriformis]